MSSSNQVAPTLESTAASTNPSAASATSSTNGGKAKVRVPPRCRFFAQGHCREGDKCRFRHDFQPKPKQPATQQSQDQLEQQAAPSTEAASSTKCNDANSNPNPNPNPNPNRTRNRNQRNRGSERNATLASGQPTDADAAADDSQSQSQSPSQQSADAQSTAAKETPTNRSANRNRNRTRKNDRKPASSQQPKPKQSQATPDVEQPTTPRAAHLAALLAAYPSSAQLLTPTHVTLSFTPSDPDFPYPLESVHLSLMVPLDYPRSPPTVHVTNEDMPERVRDVMAKSIAHRLSPGQRAAAPLSLVQVVQWIDKNLEKLVTGQLDAPKSTLVFVRPGAPSGDARAPVTKPGSMERNREAELKALERRFRGSWIQVSQEEMQLTLAPTDPEWPFPGLDVHLGLTLPLAYGAEAAAGAGAQWHVLNTDVSPRLAGRIEHVLQTASESGAALLATVNKLDRTLVDVVRELAEEDEQAEEEQMQHTSSDDDLTSSDEEVQGEQAPSAAQLAVPKSGATQIKLPALSLTGISVLECTSLSILLACVRCKNATEVHGISPLSPGTPLEWQLDSPGATGVQPCSKCAAPLGIRWTAALMHSAHPVVGYASLFNASPLDLLPCTFSATCEACTSAGQVLRRVVVGSQTKTTCRACHAGLSIAYEVARFLRVGSGGLVTGGAPLAKKPRAKSALEEGIVPGQPLPKQGRCSHYSKSYRWFRFPCCARAYPCDVCHEKGKADGHEMVRANRMICGYCSKEQPFSAAGGCAFCHAVLVAKTNSGFWEGGKGTRDVAKMSNRESKKFKGLGKTQSKKGERVGKEGAEKVKKEKGKKAEA